MKRFTPTLWLCLLAPHAQGKELDVDAFREYVKASMDAYEVPGAGIAVVEDGDVVLAEGFGVRTLGDAARVDGDTLFAIASNTKAFTTALLATLVDDGKLAWDDRVADRLPGFRLKDPYVTRELTVRDLVSHRVGFRSGSGDLLWLRSTYTRDEIVHRARFIEPSHGLRERYGYSNVMFILAGELAAAVSGRTWDDLLQASIFDAIGMATANTTLRARTADGNWATPHVFLDGKVQAIGPENVDNLGGAGAINASAKDMSRWLLLQLGHGQLGGRRVFSEKQSEEMWSPQTILGSYKPRGPLKGQRAELVAYGLGWRTRDYRAKKTVYHGGGLAGMSSRVTLVPDANIGVVVMTNQETSLQTALTHRVLDAYLDAPETDWTAAHQEAAASRWKRMEPRLKRIEERRVSNTAPSLKLEAYTRTYRDVLYGDAVVELRNDQLRLRFVKSPPFDAELEHWHHDTFVAHFQHHSIADAFVTFFLGADAKVVEMRMAPYSPYADSSYDYESLRFIPVAEARAPMCASIPGAEPLLRSGTVVLLGEIHGTAESPEAVASLACLALERGLDVTVALELPVEDTELVRAFLSGGEASSLLASAFWARAYQDGRTSEAMLELLTTLRELDLDVILIDRPSKGRGRDRFMAEQLAHHITGAPDRMVIALTGNLHNRLTVGTRFDENYEPMGFLLTSMRPERRIISLRITHGGGSAWVCTGSETSDCGPRELDGREGSPKSSLRPFRDSPGLELLPDTDGGPFSGHLYVERITASPPAHRQP